MYYLLHLIRQYPLSSLLIVVIWYLSFFTPPHTPIDNVAFVDKWTHIVMYLGTCSVIWVEYLRKHDKVDWHRTLFLAWLAPTIMGGVIEILQAYCTNGRRSGEWLDFAADALGAFLALVIGTLTAKFLSKG